MKEALHEVVLLIPCSAGCRGLLVPVYYKKSGLWSFLVCLLTVSLCPVHALKCSRHRGETFLLKCYSKGSKLASFSDDKCVEYFFCETYSTVPLSISLRFCRIICLCLSTIIKRMWGYSGPGSESFAAQETGLKFVTCRNAKDKCMKDKMHDFFFLNKSSLLKLNMTLFITPQSFMLVIQHAA